MLDQHEGQPVSVEAGLWFSFGKDRRDGIASKTTFDAVLAGERVSTTRFLRWPGHAAWSRVRSGDLVRFREKQSGACRTLVVRVMSVEPIDLWRCGEPELEAWSLAEGWAPRKGRALGGELGPALWIRHELVSPRGGVPLAPAQGVLL